MFADRKQTPTPQRAWTGTNPITQRPTNSPSLANGSDKSQPKFPSQPQQKGPADSSSDKQASERLLYLLAHCTVRLTSNYTLTHISVEPFADVNIYIQGTYATLTLKTGEQFTGVFNGSSIDKSVYTLKMVKRTRLASQQQTNGNTELLDEYIGEGDDHIMHFDVQDTADLSVPNVVTVNAHAAQNGKPRSSRHCSSASTHTAQAPRLRLSVPTQRSLVILGCPESVN
jgi:hypothetical protein